ncbi:hypothetical protein QBC44DRAFT_249128 [Cladorrhinum sp. PSN332]|nr:hypothetical protein QBC44DRAFT_249128 [Cladorrhinum sp. PSN332]
MQTGVPRRMVTVRQVSSVVHGNIHGTSFQQVQIDGWFILVNKKHRPMLRTNDTVVFFELESWIPADAPVLHGNLKKELRNPAKVNNVDGWRVSTWFTENNRQSKLMSEGFAVQIKHIPVVHAAYEADRVAAIRNGLRGNALEDHMRTIDYSQLLGVVKYEDQQPRSPNHKVPSFVIGTTINRYQNCDKMNLFQKKYHIAPKYTYQQTTKLDGSSMTVYFVNRKSKLYTALPKLEETDDNYKQHAVFSNGRFGVCSKNCDIARSTSDPNARPFFDTATRLAVNVTLHRLGESIGVQGELVGKQRAGNPYGYAQGSHDFFVYSVFDVDTRARWCPRRVAAFAQEHGLKHVPIRGEVIIPEIARSYAELQALADRLEESEGLVFRRVSDPSKCFKVLNKNWDAVKLAGRARIVGAVVAGPVGVPTQPDAAASRGEDGPGADAPRGNNKAGAVAK